MVKRNIDILIKAKDQASREMGLVSTKTRQFAFDLSKANKSAITAEATMLGMSAAAAGLAASFVAIRSSISQAADFEQLSTAFTVLIGDLDQSTILMKQLTETSIRTPFEADELLGVAKQLAAFGIETVKINGLIETLGELSAGTGQEISRLGGILGKVFTKGRAQAEELNQFAEAGIPIIQSLAQMYGKTEAEILKMASAGKIGFAQIEAALTSLTTEGGKFAGMMEKQSKTARGLQSTLSGAFKESAKTIGSFFLPAVKGVNFVLIETLAVVNETLDGLAIMANFKPDIIGGSAVAKPEKDLFQFKKIEESTALTAKQLNEWVLEMQKAEALAERLGIDTLEATMILNKSKIDQQIIVTALEKEKKIRDEINKKQESFQKKAQAAFESARLGAKGIIAGLKEEMQIQELINQGKEKTAAVQAAINAITGKGFTSEEINKIIKLREELFDLQKKQGKGTGPTARETISGTVARFLSFRQQDGAIDRTAQENSRNNKTTATNTGDMKTLLVDISSKLDSQNTVPIQAANFGV